VMRPSSACNPAATWSCGSMPFVDVVQQGRQQELLVVGPFVAGQLEHLQRVVEHVSFRMVLPRLLYPFEW